VVGRGRAGEVIHPVNELHVQTGGLLLSAPPHLAPSRVMHDRGSPAPPRIVESATSRIQKLASGSNPILAGSLSSIHNHAAAARLTVWRCVRSICETHLAKPWRTCQYQAIYAASRINQLRKSSSAASQPQFLADAVIP